MSTSYSPKIVTSGLTICLDANNTKSYSGSGSTWNDLSGNENNGTLSGSNNFSNGSFYFNGTTDSCSTSFQIVNNGSIEVWVNPSELDIANQRIIFDGRDTARWFCLGWKNGFGSSGLEFSLEDSLDADTYVTTPLSNLTVGEWSQIFCTWEDGVEAKIFINGEYKNSGNIVNSLDFESRSLCTLSIGYPNQPSYTFPPVGYFYGKIAYFNLYNQVLTHSQIKQNYNALKGRFGL